MKISVLLPDDEYYQLKELCVQRGVSMQRFVTDTAIKGVLASEKAGKQRPAATLSDFERKKLKKIAASPRGCDDPVVIAILQAAIKLYESSAL